MKRLITEFIWAETEEVLERFAALPHSTYVHIGNWVEDRYVYVRGTSKILILAHADTVWNDKIAVPEWHGNILRGKRGGWINQGKGSWQPSGIGADCRVGCAMAWHLHTEHGASVLILDGEESGGHGASLAADQMSELIAERYSFMVEVDRRGDMEFARYSDSDSEEFIHYLKEIVSPDWNEAWGTFTDVALLAPMSRVPGVNFAAGYMYEHTSNEIFFLDAWDRSRKELEYLLTMDHPTFVIPEPPKKALQKWYGKYGSSWNSNDDIPPHKDDDFEEGEFIAGAAGPYPYKPTKEEREYEEYLREMDEQWKEHIEEDDDQQESLII